MSVCLKSATISLVKIGRGFGLTGHLVGTSTSFSSHLPAQAVKAKRAIEPKISACKSLIQKIRPFNAFPKCAHDDLLDSIEIALRAFNANSRVDYKSIHALQKNYARNFARAKNRF